jgi:hypothetical protein
VTAPFTLNARVLNGGEWSPIVEADFAPSILPRVVISEINYNPPGDTDETEFVEFLNAGSTPALLNGAHFTSGLEFTFGDVSLAPGQTIVLVKDAAAFAAAYPGVPIGGVFGGGLDNGGETLTLRDIAENIIVSVTYGDSTAAGWPIDADGDGATLVLRRQFATGINPSLATSWRSSATPGGTPGAADSTVFNGIATADEDNDGYCALAEYGLGTNDGNGASKPGITTTRDASGHLVITFSHPIKADDVIVDALESTALGTWAPAQFVEEFANGGTITSSWRSSSTGPAVFLQVRVRMQ